MSRILWVITVLLFSFTIFSVSPPRLEANRAPGQFPKDRVGFSYLAPWGRGYLNVKDRTGLVVVSRAISDWQERGRRYLRRDIFHMVGASASPFSYEVEVIFAGQTSELSGTFTEACKKAFSDTPWAYAVAVIEDMKGDYASPQEADTFFQKGAVCLNPSKTIDKGIVSHELGHLIGLDHPAFTQSLNPPRLDSCRDTGRDSIMAYNYAGWKAQWPATLAPTKEDFVGPWVCDPRYPAGLDYIYQYTNTPGWGNPVMIDVRVGIMNASPSPVTRGQFPIARYGITIVNFSNTTVYDVRLMIGAAGTAEEVGSCRELPPGGICGEPQYRYGVYSAWPVGIVDAVNFGGDFYITPKRYGALREHPRLEYVFQDAIESSRLGDVHVLFMESNVNPVSTGHPVTYAIIVCNNGSPAWIRPVIGSDGERHYLSWEWIETGACSSRQTYVEYYFYKGTDFIGFGGERLQDGVVKGIPPRFLVQEIKLP